MAELLLELLTEEIPARMQARAAEDLHRLAGERLAAAGLTFSEAHSFVTPRRLTLLVEGLPTAQPDVSEERRGPRVGAPPNAVEGFLKSAGISSLEQCEQRDTGKGVFYFATIRRAGRATAEVVPALLRALIVEFPWPKSMRFPAAGFRWVRPLTSALCLFDGKVLPLDLDSVPVGNATRGHRFLSPASFTVGSFAEYRQKLRDARVILRAEDRSKAISLALYEKAAEAGLTVKDDPALLEEVTGLVEWPVVLMGATDPTFLDLPPEVLTTSMRAHQKYFACLDRGGNLASRFLLVSNIVADDGGKAIVGRNDRCPSAPVSIAVALADKIDTLAGFFSIDEMPTGSKDPYALRRAALGIIRVILENQLRIPLLPVFSTGAREVEPWARLHDDRSKQPNLGSPRVLLGQRPLVVDLLLSFFADRLKVHLREQGVRHDLIAAVFALGNEDDLIRLLARVAALDAFLKTEDGANLLVAYRRAANIVRIEEKKDGRSYAEPPDPKLLAEPAEATLAAALEQARARSAAALEREAFTEAVAALAGFRLPVD